MASLAHLLAEAMAMRITGSTSAHRLRNARGMKGGWRPSCDALNNMKRRSLINSAHAGNVIERLAALLSKSRSTRHVAYRRGCQPAVSPYLSRAVVAHLWPSFADSRREEKADGNINPNVIMMTIISCMIVDYDYK